MKISAETFEKLEKNKDLIKGFGLNMQNQLSVIAENRSKACDFIEKEFPDQMVHIYHTKYCGTCDCCGGVFYHEDMEETKDGEHHCSLCSWRVSQ